MAGKHPGGTRSTPYPGMLKDKILNFLLTLAWALSKFVLCDKSHKLWLRAADLKGSLTSDEKLINLF